MLQSVNELEKEEGKAATDGLTEDHYRLIILDIFSGNSICLHLKPFEQ